MVVDVRDSGLTEAPGASMVTATLGTQMPNVVKLPTSQRLI